MATPGALSALAEVATSPSALLDRHVSGDWGACDAADARANLRALDEGGRIFSVYVIEGVKFWIITEADRSCTTLLLPEDY